jgi:hypothetical protein
MGRKSRASLGAVDAGGVNDQADPAAMADFELVNETADEVGLFYGRLISMSKSSYIHRYPRHVAVFNAVIVDDQGHGDWWGDLDLTLDEPKLRDLAKLVGQRLHVLYEADSAPLRHARADNHDVELAVITITSDGATELGAERGASLLRDRRGRLVRPKKR